MPSKSCYAETDEPYHAAHWSPLRALITPQWKYIRSPRAELYDLMADPHELRNVAPESLSEVQKLEAELAAWENRMQQGLAQNVSLSEEQRRALSSLGYTSSHGKMSDAKQTLRDVKDMLPYYYKLTDASAMIDAGRYDTAEPILREILAADDHYFTAHAELGRSLLKRKKYPEAVQSLRRAMELEPGAEGASRCSGRRCS